MTQGSDAILFKGPSAIVGYNIAEKLRIPCAEIALFPVTRTRAFPSFLFGGGKDRGRLLSDLVWRLSEQTIWQLMQREHTNGQRRNVLGLPPLPLSGPLQRQNREGMPLFYAYSSMVLPRPSDWPERIHVPSYYFSDAPPNWQPPEDLLRFLAHGSPPVYVGFGSIPLRRPQDTLQLIAQALDLSGQRAVLVSGWSGLGKDCPLPEQVFRVEDIPHSWLFPRMAAVVHHGGAGTTGESIRSGVPSVLTPFAADQPTWGERLHAMGVGPAPLPYKKLTGQQLAKAIGEAVTNIGMRTRAAELGRRMQTEDGPGRTLDLFFEFVERFRRRK